MSTLEGSSDWEGTRTTSGALISFRFFFFFFNLGVYYTNTGSLFWEGPHW